MNQNIFSKTVVALMASGLITLSHAQEHGDVFGGKGGPGKVQPTWVSLNGFSGEALEALEFDLYVQGFNFTNPESAQYFLSASNNGNLQARAIDRYTKADVAPAKLYTGSKVRQQVHWFADD